MRSGQPRGGAEEPSRAYEHSLLQLLARHKSSVSAANWVGLNDPPSWTPESPSMHMMAHVIGAVPAATHFVAHASMAGQPLAFAHPCACMQQFASIHAMHAGATVSPLTAASIPVQLTPEPDPDPPPES